MGGTEGCSLGVGHAVLLSTGLLVPAADGDGWMDGWTDTWDGTSGWSSSIPIILLLKTYGFLKLLFDHLCPWDALCTFSVPLLAVGTAAEPHNHIASTAEDGSLGRHSPSPTETHGGLPMGRREPESPVGSSTPPNGCRALPELHGDAAGHSLKQSPQLGQLHSGVPPEEHSDHHTSILHLRTQQGSELLLSPL